MAVWCVRVDMTDVPARWICNMCWTNVVTPDDVHYDGEPHSIGAWCPECGHLSDHVLLTQIAGEE